MAAAKKKSADGKFTVEGELTIYTAAEMKEKFGGLLNSEAIEIDLAQVSEIDTAGLQLLLLLQRECAKTNKSLVFSNPSEAVLSCWNMCNLKENFGAIA
ncbi:MAG: STAS domain-containing protein [Spongiibacteraceae bacterium]